MALRKKTETVSPTTTAAVRRQAALGWVQDAIDDIEGSTEELQEYAVDLTATRDIIQAQLDDVAAHLVANDNAVARLSILVDA